VADANDPTKDKEALASDVKALGQEIQNIFDKTDFNGTSLITGVSTGSFSFQTGHDSTDTLDLSYTGDITAVNIDSITTVDSTTVGSLNVTTQQGKVENALGSIGNDIQRLDVKENYLTSAISNATSSVSRLFDADMAMEQIKATRASISSQASTAMLSQLNMAPQNVLSLFG
jgi:flagellin